MGTLAGYLSSLTPSRKRMPRTIDERMTYNAVGEMWERLLRLSQRISWVKPGTSVRGVFLGPVGPYDPEQTDGYVLTPQGRVHVFSRASQSLRRQLEPIPLGALLIVTFTGTEPGATPGAQRKMFTVLWRQRRYREQDTDRFTKIVRHIDVSTDAGLMLGAQYEGRTMSMGARCERILASRLVALERLLDKADDESAKALWAEYYQVVDLWLRSRAPVTPAPLMTKAQLEERFKASRTNGNGQR